MKTRVVAIQNGPYRSGLPSSMSRNGARGYREDVQRRRTSEVWTSKNWA